MAEGKPPDYEPAMRAIAMPADANPSGDIFGGWIMSQMDLAGGNVAYHRAGGRVATVAVESISFLVPVAIDDEVSCYAQIIRVGRSSLSTKIEVWTRRRAGEERMKVTEGIFTYVAIDDTGRPRHVPKG